jgi:predicted AAA+ superfamily ATPase
MNAQVVNIASTARDVGVARPTVARYFQTMVDTLVAVWLPAWRPRIKVKEVGHPKFYLFDCGVVRASRNALRDSIAAPERGTQLETLLLGEMRAYQSSADIGGQFFYYRTPAGSEIDFVWQRGKTVIGVEVKASTKWRSEYGATLREMVNSGVLKSGYVVYGGDNAVRDGSIIGLPINQFLKRLHDGAILG